MKSKILLISTLMLSLLQNSNANDLYYCKTEPYIPDDWRSLMLEVEVNEGIVQSVALRNSSSPTVKDSHPKILSKDNQKTVYEINYYATGWDRHLITRSDGNFLRMTYEFMAMVGGDGAGTSEKSTYRLACQKNLNKSCGLSGTVQNRIANCATTKKNWNLVTRTSDLKEVWKDPSGLIWGDKLPAIMNLANGLKACSSSLTENGSLTSLSFKLPTLIHFKAAEANGIRAVLPNMELNYWTSTVRSDGNNVVFVGSPWGNNPSDQNAHESNSTNIRCVAQ